MLKVLSAVLASSVLIAGIGLAGCKPKEAAAADPRTAERLVAITTVTPSVGADAQFTGIVGARVQSDLGFRVPGKIVERLVDAGQSVRKGQALMRMDPTDYTHAMVAQAGSVAAARAKWIQAAADEKRNNGLVETGAISQAAYDQVKAAADSAKALLDAAEAQQSVAKNQEGYSYLVADGDGAIMETLAEPGQVVAAGQVVVRLAHAGPREAIVNLPETVRPALGSTATARLFGDTAQIAARLRQRSETADVRTRTFEARYVLEGAGASAPLGATVTISLKRDAVADRLSVPLGAIDDEGQGPGIWLVDPKSSKVTHRKVQVHVLGGEFVEVSGGDLVAGDTIVAAGGHYLHEGETVRRSTITAAMR